MRDTRWYEGRTRNPSKDAQGHSRMNKSWSSSKDLPRSAGREGIEPSLRVLGARPVTMTLQPKLRLVRESDPSHPIDSGTATPVASRGELCPRQDSNLPQTV